MECRIYNLSIITAVHLGGVNPTSERDSPNERDTKHHSVLMCPAVRLHPCARTMSSSSTNNLAEEIIQRFNTNLK